MCTLRSTPSHPDKIFYGGLERILVCELPDDRLWSDTLQGTARLLVKVTLCVTLV
jgi:hypothetical protein